MDESKFEKALQGDVSVLENMNEEEACVHKTPGLENNIAHIAVQYGHLDLLKAAINRFPKLLLQKNKNDDTPLHMAAQLGSKEMVKTLIISHLNINSTTDHDDHSVYNFLMEINKQGNTPFHVALRRNNMEAAKELFQYVKDYNTQILVTRNKSGDVPLHLYVKYCVSGVIVGSWIYNDLHGSPYALCAEMVKANPYAMLEYDDEGLNPVMRTAQDGHTLLILLFLCYPLLLDCRDEKGKSFLHYLRLRINACGKDYTLNLCEKIIAQVEVSSLIFSQDNDGNTPLHLAIMDSDFDLAQIILRHFVSGKLSEEKGVILRIKNNEGNTVTDLITRQPVVPSKLKKLMERVLMGKQMDEELYTAARKADTKIFKKRRSEISGDVPEEDTKDDDYFLSQDEDGNNIIHIALQHNEPHEHVANFVQHALYRFPSLMYQSDSNGDTPLHIAARLPYDIGERFLREAFDYWCYRESRRGFQKVPPWRVTNLKGHTLIHEVAITSNYQVLPTLSLSRSLRYDDATWEPMSDVNNNGETFLHLLARYGHKIDGGTFELYYLYMGECKGAVYMLDVDGFTPILRAAHCGQIWFVKAIGERYPKSLYIRDSCGRTVLHHFCTSVLDVVNELEGVLQLWTERACYTSEAAGTFKKDHDDLTFTKDHDGNTPLHLAIIHRNFEVAQFFIRFCLKLKSSLRKEIVDIKNKDGKTIMNLVTCESDISPDLKKLIEQASLRPIMDKTLYEAATTGDTTVFDRIKELSYDYFCSQNYDGSNIIHIALQHNKISFIQEAHKNFPELMYSKNFKGDTPLLHVAAHLKTYDLEQFFHDSRLLITMRDLRGNSFLHEAARSANYKVITSLLSIIKDDFYYIKDVNNDGESILHLVARYATFAAKEFLEKHSLKMKPLTSMRDLEGFTPVLRAVQCGRLGVAKLLLGENRDSAKIPDKKGRNVLHHLKALVVDLDDDLKDVVPIWMDLFKYGEVDELRSVQNEDGNTPLHLAIIDAAFIKAKFLIEMCLKSDNQAELDIFNNDGFTVFDLLASRAHIPATKELQQVASRSYVNERKSIINMMDQKLYKAAVKGNSVIFDSSECDEYFQSQTPGGSNLIHVALGHQSVTVVEFVAKALARFKILSIKPDNNGDTPLHIAAKWKSSVELVNLLIQASDTFLKEQNSRATSFHVAPWAIKNCKGSYPIHEALQTGNLEAARCLLTCDNEAATRVNDLGENPLHAFAKNGANVNKDEYHADNFVKALTEDIPGAKLAYMRDNEGLTPLLSASRSGRFQVVKAILKYCPQSAYLRDPCGRNFLHLLRFTGEDVDESLAGTFNKTGKQLFEIEEANAQRLVQDYEGNTPLHYAIKTGNSVAAIVLTHKCLEDNEQKELKLVDKQGQTVPDLLAKYDVPNEIIEKIRTHVPEAVYLARSSYGIRKAEMKESANALSVVAALLATITFAAAFQVPGGFDGDDGSPVLLTKPIFALFVVANSTAMCCSMLCLFLLLWVMGIGKIHGSLMVLDISIALLQSSFYLTLLAFTLGVFVVTVKKSFWLAILVCGLCFLTLTFITWRVAIQLLAKCVDYGIPTPRKLKRSINKFFMEDRKNANSSVPNMTHTGTFVHNTPHVSSYVPNATYTKPSVPNVAHASSYMPDTTFTGPSTSNMTHASSSN